MPVKVNATLYSTAEVMELVKQIKPNVSRQNIADYSRRWKWNRDIKGHWLAEDVEAYFDANGIDYSKVAILDIAS